MKKNKYLQELKLLREMKDICLDILEELKDARTYFAIKKKERYENKVKEIDAKIKNFQ